MKISRSEKKEQTIEKNAKTPSKRKTAPKQIIALTGAVLLVLLYLITLIAAIMDSSASAYWFRLSLGASFALPLLIWIYTWLARKITNRPAIGDPETPEHCDDETLPPE